MSNSVPCQIKFDSRSLAEANFYAEDLQEALQGAVHVEIERENPNSMDIGSVLVLAMTATSLARIANAILVFWGKQPNVTFSMETSYGKISIAGLAGKDVPALMNELSKLLPPNGQASTVLPALPRPENNDVKKRRHR